MNKCIFKIQILISNTCNVKILGFPTSYVLIKEFKFETHKIWLMVVTLLVILLVVGTFFLLLNIMKFNVKIISQ
jgi:hypothetical protein